MNRPIDQMVIVVQNTMTARKIQMNKTVNTPAQKQTLPTGRRSSPWSCTIPRSVQTNPNMTASPPTATAVCAPKASGRVMM